MRTDIILATILLCSLGQTTLAQEPTLDKGNDPPPVYPQTPPPSGITPLPPTRQRKDSTPANADYRITALQQDYTGYLW
ncbi:MAG TPA: transcriptional regulator, partial [Allocoleopsis sp.]